MARRYDTKTATKMQKTMHEFKHGTLRSGSGGKVKSRAQAIAIGLSQARRAGGKVPPPPKHHARRRAHMTKAQFEQMFRAEILPRLPAHDRPAKREAWNNIVDAYIRDGQLPESAGNWGHPRWLETTGTRHHASRARANDCGCTTGRCPHRRSHATKREIEGAAVRSYGDSGQTMAYIEWSDGSRSDGDLKDMEPLLERARREGVRVRHEVR